MVAIVLLLAVAAIAPRTLPPQIFVVPLYPRLMPPPPVRPTQRGGSQQSRLLARQGQPPERARARVFIPPVIERTENPVLPVRAALLEAPDAPRIIATIGDPLGILGGDGGLGKGFNGIGNGPGDGIGDGPGGGFGGAKLLAAQITRQPRLLRKIEPEYSEEARKARVEGVVRLRIDIGLDGVPTNIQVISGVGLGLDERAVEAIRQWRFEPAEAGGRPVVAPALIEVGFRLL
jgi:TonB family protein